MHPTILPDTTEGELTSPMLIVTPVLGQRISKPEYDKL